MSENLQYLRNVLIVDSNEKPREILQKYFNNEGYHVVTAVSGTEMRARLAERNFGLVLLDIELPGEDGLAITRSLRNESDIGIIIVTARSDLIDRIVGIEMGADDYIAKPFHLREVLARVRAVMRRTRGSRPSRRTEADGAAVGFGRWQLYFEQRRVIDADGAEIELTSSEFEMLSVLVRHAGKVLTRDRLMDLTRGRNWNALDRTIDAHIARLRKKIEPDPKHPTIIKSVRGVGYVFAAKVRHISG
ncbi:response regulator [Chelativorans sp. Marseille-P2723]|uniref:response regulator n=1 Tax=Chelativorans sp. Marseille-P2723 TaxID=2709133 RepID=UPI001570F773|nr:response regulator [Chelativorans sp. Marseille-P2723]